MFKKKYYIAFTGILEHGTLRIWFFKRPIVNPNEQRTEEGSIQWATKFRFLWWAKFNCWLANKCDDQWRTYTVKTI